MINFRLNRTALAAASFLTTLAFSSGAVHAAEFSAEQKNNIQTIVKDYIAENPDVIVSALEQYRIDQQRAAQQQMESAVENYIDELTSPDAPSIGPKDAAVTIVEFFDYNCGYCKRALPDIQDTLKQNDDVRFVFREMPILSESSRDAARYALAAHKQDKYFEYHSALMELRGQKDIATLKNIGRELGLDVDQLEEDSKSPEVLEMLEKDLEMAQAIGIRGTPAFIVGGRVYRGYLGPDGLERAIKEARDDQEG